MCRALPLLDVGGTITSVCINMFHTYSKEGMGLKWDGDGFLGQKRDRTRTVVYIDLETLPFTIVYSRLSTMHA